MSALNCCPHCSSFNPADQGICLHCEQALAQSSGGSNLVKRVLKTAGVIAISMSLTACYGMVEECTSEDADQDGVCSLNDCDDNDPMKQFDCGGAQAPLGGETVGEP